MEIIQFFFGNFWHFIGLVIILLIVGDILLQSIDHIKGNNEDEEDCPYECLSCKVEHCLFDKEKMNGEDKYNNRN